MSMLYLAGRMDATAVVPFAAFGFTKRDVETYNLGPSKHRLFTIGVLHNIISLQLAISVVGTAQATLMSTEEIVAAAAAAPPSLPELRELLIILAQDTNPIVALARYHESAPPTPAPVTDLVPTPKAGRSDAADEHRVQEQAG